MLGIIGLSGGEIILIFLVFLIIPAAAVVIGLSIYLFIQKNKQPSTTSPAASKLALRILLGFGALVVGGIFLLAIAKMLSSKIGIATPIVWALLLLLGLVIFAIVRFVSGSRLQPPPIPPAIQVQPPPRKCPKCGAQLRPDVPEGLCPACLLQHGIATEGGAPPGTPAFTPPPLLELAKLFPQLEILEIIGQGGMGAVYKARQPSLDRFVALKILAPRSGGDLDFAGRFSREARALARLSHPNIVAVYDFGQVQRSRQREEADRLNAPTNPPPDVSGYQGDLSYFIMEYVDGPNLRQVEQAGRLTPREALQIIPQICAALQFAHDEGIVHRDIKPENVLLDKKGRVKIADFGLAKILGQEADFRLTGARDVMGTPHYMAPEQVEKPQEVDHRADIYSLGVVFYEMLTGELPLGKFDPPSHKVQIDVRLDDVVLRSLANNPDRRYQNVSEVKTELESIAHTPGSGTNVPESTHFLRTGVGIAVGACVAVLFIAFLGLLAGIAIPNFIRARNKVRAQHAAAQAEANHSNAVPEVHIATNPPASAETWTPTFAPGEKPDLQKIVNEADDLMKHGQYEQALGRHIWLQRHQIEYGGSYQNVSSILSWIELGRRYPKAKQALLEIRDGEVREFAEGRGFSDLFGDIQFINHQLQDDDATYELFNAIRKGDPQLADQCRFYVAGVMFSKGEYQWCYDFLGDPESHLSGAKRDFDMEIERCKWSAENQARSRQQMAEFNRQRGITNLPIPSFPDTSGMQFSSATNRFVGAVSMEIEVLLGTGHASEAARIRDEALALMKDPRLESAITDAEAHIQKRKAATVDTSTTNRQGTNSAYANLKIPALGQWQPAVTNIPDASRETWEPTLDPGAKPDLMAILQEAKELMTQQRYEDSLQRQIWYHNHSNSDPSQLGVRNSFALADWVELGRRYPKAMQALIEIRNENERKIYAGEGYFDLFMETASMNDVLGDQEKTYALFKTIAASPDQKLAQQCYSIVEGLLASHRDYELCMNYIGDPEKRFKKLQDQWQRSKKWEQQQDDMRRQMDERMRAAQKQSESNGIASPSWPQHVIPLPPKLADKTFVAQTRQLIKILVGAGHQSDAENIHREATLLLDDPALKSAVDDAEKEVHAPKQSTPQNRVPSLGSIAMPPMITLPPPQVQPPPSLTVPGNVIRPLRMLPGRTNTNSFTQNSPALTLQEQMAIIEIERAKMKMSDNPIAGILPPTQFSAPVNPTKGLRSTNISSLTIVPLGSNQP
jgi:serine/threonine protein kinase